MSFVRQWMGALKALLGGSKEPPLSVVGADIPCTLRRFQDEFGIQFLNPALLQQSLTHRSFLGGEAENLPASNERLEFLGDAVLELVVIDHLYHTYTDEREGELTQKKSLLVSKAVLADQAEQIGLGNYVFLSEAERGSGGAERDSILADAYEAVLGAIYLDQGIEMACDFVRRSLLQHMKQVLADGEKQNFKSMLQERVQAHFRLHPRYQVVSQEGPDHDKRFTVQVMVRHEILGMGTGPNKKAAEQRAAQEALDSGTLTAWLDQASLRDSASETSPPSSGEERSGG